MDDRFNRLLKLEKAVSDAAQLIDHFSRELVDVRDAVLVQAETITELRVQTRFLMGVIKCVPPGVNTTIVGADGKQKLDLVDGQTIYNQYHGRELTLRLLQHEQQEELFFLTAQEMKDHGDERTIEDIIAALREEHTRDRESSSEGGSRSDSQSSENPARTKSVSA